MQPDRFQQYALETWYPNDGRVPVDEQINHAILQLNSEAGELASLWAKHLFKPGHFIDRQSILGELGDVWYYIRIIAWLFGITTDELTEFNYEKLKGGHGWNGASEKVLDRLG